MDTREQAKTKAVQLVGSLADNDVDATLSMLKVSSAYEVKEAGSGEVRGVFTFAEMEAGDIYEVSDDGKDWSSRYFSHIGESGKPKFVDYYSLLENKNCGYSWKHYRLLCKKQNFEVQEGV